MNDPSAALGKMVPGFDFLQNLARGAGSALPGMGHWVAPTLDPEEIGKRIEELRTVQFWLEQNVRMMAATIQALEVQRMTLATLHGMNVPLADLRGALMAGAAGKGDGAAAHAAGPATPSPSDWQSGPFGQALAASAARRAAPPPAPPPAAPPSAATAGATPPAAADAASEPSTAQGTPPAGRDAAAAAPGTNPALDPVRWWDALTQQFTQLASQALKDMPSQTEPAGDLMTRSTQAAQAAQETLRQQAALVQQAAQALGAAAMAPAGTAPGLSGSGSGPTSAPGARAKTTRKSASKSSPKTAPKVPARAAAGRGSSRGKPAGAAVPRRTAQGRGKA